MNLTNEEITESWKFDFLYQYALHTTRFKDQPVSELSLSRSLLRLAAYELITGEDLLHQCFTEMAESMRNYLEISPAIKRMDSMMLKSNIWKRGRLELLYTCLSNLMKALHRDRKIKLLEGLKHYADPNVRNRVVHHEQDIPQADRLQKVMDAATDFLPRCVDAYADSENYQFLERAIREQTKKDSDGHDILRGKGDGINCRRSH